MKTENNFATIDFSSLFENIEFNNSKTLDATIENQKGNLISTTTTQTVKHIFYNNFEFTISGSSICHIVWKKYNNGIHKRVYICKTLSEAIEKVNQLRIEM